MAIVAIPGRSTYRQHSSDTLVDHGLKLGIGDRSGCFQQSYVITNCLYGLLPASQPVPMRHEIFWLSPPLEGQWSMDWPIMSSTCVDNGLKSASAVVGPTCLAVPVQNTPRTSYQDRVMADRVSKESGGDSMSMEREVMVVEFWSSCSVRVKTGADMCSSSVSSSSSEVIGCSSAKEYSSFPLGRQLVGDGGPSGPDTDVYVTVECSESDML
ncbi:hypothetical protein Tco_0902779 [Tanacetum coccineum]